MSGDQLIGRAADPVKEVVRNIEPGHLGMPTPCPGFDVRGLIHHLLVWGPPQEAAARKEIASPAEDASGEPADLVAHLDRMTEAWSAPEAWQGTTQVGGPPEMPAATIGGMVIGEIVIHGWDLARATDQKPVWDDDVLRFVHAELEQTAAMGRDMGLYGPEVAVPETAPLLDRVLGLSGRDPRS